MDYLSTYVTQWKVLMKRNLLLKRRNYRQLVTVIFVPVLTTFYILCQSDKPYVKPSEITGVDYDLPITYQKQSLEGVSNNFYLCVAPKKIEESFLKSIHASLSLYGQKKNVIIWKFENEEHLNAGLLTGVTILHNKPNCDAGIVFVGNISVNGTYIVRVPEDRCSPVSDKYCSYGILSNIQQAVDNAFLQEWTGNSSFKLPPSKIHGFVDQYESARANMYRVLRFLFLVILLPIIIETIENNKEKYMQIKEIMFVMGTRPLSYRCAGLLCDILLIIPAILIVSIALFFANMSSITAILYHLLLWFGLGCSLVAFVTTLMHYFSTLFVHFLVMVIFLFDITTEILNDGDVGINKCFAILIPTVAYKKGFTKIMVENNICGASMAVSLIYAEFFLYAILGFLLEHLFPYGIHFPSWRKVNPNGKNSKLMKRKGDLVKEEHIGSLQSSTNVDPCMKFEKIKKSFCWFFNPYTALDEANLSIYKGEVACLMGHNGSGKSTFVKIISRALRPDEGRIVTSTSLKLGICPQENILYDDLTTYEHLQMFGSLKGVPSMKLDLVVTTLLETFDLLDEKDTRSKKLSDGQKRMLCVALAFIGEPEVVLLDEPSNGMSPRSRKLLWNVLRDYTKYGHSVVFTTHDVDEAELFSDRIAFLFYGRVMNFGAAMDIKKQCGGGYNIRINLHSKPSLCRKSELVNLISDLPSKPEVVLPSDSEVLVKLQSFDATDCIELFNKIEEQYKDIGSDCLTISVSSLEEIFFSLADNSSKPTLEEKKAANQIEVYIPKFNYVSSTWTSFKEIFRARFRVLIRRFTLLFPIFLCAALLFSYKLYHRLTRETFYIGPRLYVNGVLQVKNASGNPLNDFETSLSKLHITFETDNSSVCVNEKDLLETEIENYYLSSKGLDVKWNWTAYTTNRCALPVVQNLMSNIVWKTFDDELGRELKIIIQPISIFEKHFSAFWSEAPITLMYISLFMIMMAIFLGVEVLKEREQKIIWLITVTTNKGFLYWTPTYCIQLLIFCSSFFLFQIIMLIFGDQFLLKCVLFVNFNLCVPGCLATVHLIVKYCKSVRTVIILLLGLIETVTIFIFLVFIIGVLKDIPYIYVLNTLVISIFPLYSPLGLIILLTEGETFESVLSGTHWKIVCYFIIPLSWLLYSALISYLDWTRFGRSKKMKVMNQETWNKVHNPKSIVELKSVKKSYASKLCCLKEKETVAIKDVSMSFFEGETFALMGSNGTGKSTLMKLLSLEEVLTSGKISIRDSCMESITYCPEGNTVWFDLTVREQLRLFAILNGVPIKYADEKVDNVLLFHLLKHVEHKKAGHLSMGLQRKLTVALSLLGNSKIVLLDEPTTGMDPISKNYFWKKLHKEFPGTTERTLILTTKSSNEAGVNCARIGLFSDGTLRSLGTTETFKKETSKGFQMNIKLKNRDNRKMKNYIMSEIPKAVGKYNKGAVLQYYIPREAFKSMSELFMAVAKIQAFKNVESCFICQRPLNEIFLETLCRDNTQITEDEYAV
ncbi:unnamed protein product [Larinioides sclopetarius]